MMGKCTECGFEFDTEINKVCPECGCPVSEEATATNESEQPNNTASNGNVNGTSEANNTGSSQNTSEPRAHKYDLVCPTCGRRYPYGTVKCLYCYHMFRDSDLVPKEEQQQEAQQEKPDDEVNKDNAKITVEQLIDRVLNTDKKASFGGFFVKLLLTIIAVGVAYLAIAQFRESHTSEYYDSSNRVLIVEIDDDIAVSDLSDSTQINKALSNGGMIRLSNSSIEDSLSYKIERYAASDSSGSYWVLGALLNYISSEGWRFVQAPQSGLNDKYYFVK